jgi:type III pantothenate kinase
MTPDVVVDIGNSRMKWGRCEGCSAIRVMEVFRLPLDDSAAWDAQLAKLPPPSSVTRKWAVASVNPPALHRFLAWLHKHGDTLVFEKYTDLPIRLNVDQPETVGLDRLFGAVAAKAMSLPGWPAITVDVGTAVTVNLIDAEGVFQGGAIFPGPRLMGRALHEFTAKLPLIDLTDPVQDLWRPAKNTADAIRLGIDAALGAGVAQLVDLFIDQCPAPPLVFVTGGGGHLTSGYPFERASGVRQFMTLTLEGIRIAAEALP